MTLSLFENKKVNRSSDRRETQLPEVNHTRLHKLKKGRDGVTRMDLVFSLYNRKLHTRRPIIPSRPLSQEISVKEGDYLSTYPHLSNSYGGRFV